MGIQAKEIRRIHLAARSEDFSKRPNDPFVGIAMAELTSTDTARDNVVSSIENRDAGYYRGHAPLVWRHASD